MITLKQILQGKTVQIPVYDFVQHSRWAPSTAALGLSAGAFTTAGLVMAADALSVWFLFPEPGLSSRLI